MIVQAAQNFLDTAADQPGSFGIRIILLLSIVLALITALVFYYRYRKRLYEAVEHEQNEAYEEPRHRSTAPADFLPWILIALLLVWNATILGKVNELSSSLFNLQSTINRLWAEVQEISEIQKEQAKQNSAVAGFSWGFGNIDSKNHTIELLVEVLPRESSDDTEVSLRFAGQTTQLKRAEKGRYTGSLPLSLTAEAEEAAEVFIRTDGRIVSERISDELMLPLYEPVFAICFPYAGYLIGEMGYQINNEEELKLSGTLTVDNIGGKLAKLIKARAEVEIEGEIVDTIPLTIGEDSAYAELDRCYPILPGQAAMIYVVAENDAGYLVRSRLDCFTAAEGSFSVYPDDGKWLTLMDREGNPVR